MSKAYLAYTLTTRKDWKDFVTPPKAPSNYKDILKTRFDVEQELGSFFFPVENQKDAKGRGNGINLLSAPNANSHFITGASTPDQAQKRVEQKLDAQTQLLKDANQLAKDTLNWFKSRKTDAAVAITPFLIS